MGERRKASRQKSFLRGCVYFNNRRSAIDCLVRDVSATGARLVFAGAVTTPDVMDLNIPQKRQMLQAHVQWRQPNEIGVTFAAPESQPGTGTELATRVEKLEAEIATLKRLVKKLKAEADGETEAA